MTSPDSEGTVNAARHAVAGVLPGLFAGSP